MTTVGTEQLTETGSTAIRTGLERLLASHGPIAEGGSRVLVVPDVHYPYHPSTGLVTNPTVVEVLLDMIGAPVALGLATSGHVESETGELLGYHRLAEQAGIPVVSLDAADRVKRRVSFVGSRISLAVPEPLLTDAVVVVPTLRRSPRFGVAAGMVTLAHAVTDDPTSEEVLAVTRACWPQCALLDGSFAYPGEPRELGILAVSDDVVALSHYAADMLGVPRSEAPHLVTRRTPPSPRRSFSALFRRRQRSEGDGLMAAGYRMYARVAGDLVPPQMLSRSDRQ